MLSFSSPIGSTAHRHRRGALHPAANAMSMARRGPSAILPRLWLSGLYTAVDEEQLVALGITHVVSVIEHRPKYPPTLRLKTLHIPLQDVNEADILQHLDATTAFIQSALEDKRNVVLVHCAMGISRSATVVCAYLIAALSMNPQEALEFVMSKREIVCPNLGFRRQLEIYYAAHLRGGLGGGKRLRKVLPPPIRATITHGSLLAERIRVLHPHPHPHPHPPPPAISRRGSR